MTAALKQRAGAALPPVKVVFEFGNLGHGECKENWRLWKGFCATRRNPCREGEPGMVREEASGPREHRNGFGFP